MSHVFTYRTRLKVKPFGVLDLLIMLGKFATLNSGNGIRFISELLGFLTLSTVRNSKYKKSQRFGNLILTLSPEGERVKKPTLLGPSEGANLNHWPSSLN
jgi:hypothetical protein